VDEFTGERLVAPGSIPTDLTRVKVEPVGNYALKFTWSDEHDTGIYTYDYLRAICSCDQCRAGGLKETPPNSSDKGFFEA